MSSPEAALPPAPSRSRLKSWSLYVGVWTLLALFFATQWLFSPDYGANGMRWKQLLLQSFTNWYIWGALTLGIIWMAKRFPFDRERLGRSLLIYLALGVTCVTVRISTTWLLSQVTTLYGQTGLRERMLYQFHNNLFFFAAIVGAVYAVNYHRKLRERELRAAHLETRLAQAQLQVLRMQLQPHFLFNTLHGISTLMHRDVEAADAMLTQLSELLRIAMTTEGEQETSLKREMDFLERYVDIQQTRFGERLQVRFDVEPETLDALVPTLLLQPLVENAIRHAIAPRASGGRVEVAARRDNGALRLEVSDDGPGMPVGAAPRQGLGIANTRARLEQLYGRSHRIDFSRGARGGLLVRLTLPFRLAPAEATTS
jgi:two-component system, LytTR family, sensor kinase